jgi:hypothetical protein
MEDALFRLMAATPVSTNLEIMSMIRMKRTMSESEDSIARWNVNVYIWPSTLVTDQRSGVDEAVHVSP